MAEDVKMSEVIDEIKNATEEEITEVIEDWFRKTRTDGMKLGAQFIAAGVMGAIRANLNKARPSLRDYERTIKDISKIIAVQLKPKNNSEKVDANEAVEEVANDGTAE